MDISTVADALFSVTAPSVAQYDNLAAVALGRGIDAFTTEDYDRAIREFRRTIALSPYSENAQKAFEYVASAYEQSGRPEEAIKTLKQAIAVFPSADGLNLGLGNLLFAEENYDEALAQYQDAVKKNPTVSQNYYSVGQTYLATEKYAEAEAQFKKVVAISPRDASGYYALGQTYRKANRPAEAEQMFQKALSLDHGFADAHFELGLLYTESHQTENASKELDILDTMEKDALYEELKQKIYENSAPRFLMAYILNMNLAAGPQTKVSDIDPALAAAGSAKTFTLSFIFDKEMDPAAVEKVTNWSITRSTSAHPGGAYNWGQPIPDTEVTVSPTPLSVFYDQVNQVAQVTFAVGQNAQADGTIDLSHLLFSFRGTDLYGQAMDPSADEYSGVSRIV